MSDVAVSADSAPLVNSTVSNSANSVNVGLYGVSSTAAAAILAGNKILSGAHAAIVDSTVDAGGDVSVVASDDAGIYANAKIVASSSTTNDGGVRFFTRYENDGITTQWTTASAGLQAVAFGDKVRVVDNFGFPAFTATLFGTQVVPLVQNVTTVVLGDRYAVSRLTSASGIRLLASGDLVTLDEAYEHGGNPTATYRYHGPSGRVDLGGEDYSDTARWTLVDGAAGSVYRYVGPSGNVDVNDQDYLDPALWAEIGGKVGTVYEYMGEDASMNLATQDYTDLGLWKPVKVTQLLPAGFNLTDSSSRTIGLVVVLNDVRSETLASVEHSIVTAANVLVQAIEQAVIRSTADVTTTSSGGSSITGQGASLALSGTSTTNRILSKANAWVGDGVVTASGDFTVSASNLSEVDATTQSASSSGANSVGIQLAFNTIGWKPTNLFFAALDALLGDPLVQNAAFGGMQPAETQAFVSGTPVHAGGDVSVTAVGGSRVTAVVGNEATSAPAAIFGAGGMSVGAVLASSMIASVVRSFVDYGPGGGELTPASPVSTLNPGDRVKLADGSVFEFVGTPRGPPPGGLGNENFASSDWRQVNLLSAGGDTAVLASDEAQIDSTTTMYAEVSPTNDAGKGILNTWAGSILDEYSYTSRSGTKLLAFGDLVRVADDDANADVAGKVFQWMGTPQTVDLGATDYADFELWKERTATSLITDSLTYAALSEVGVLMKKEGLTGGSDSYYGLIDHNDVRTTVEAYVDEMTLRAGGSVSSARRTRP